MGHVYTSSLRGISYESLDYKNVKSGEKVERKLCNFVDTCSSEGFCITAKSARDPFPCNHHLGDYIGSPIEIYYNQNLTAWDRMQKTVYTIGLAIT